MMKILQTICVIVFPECDVPVSLFFFLFFLNILFLLNKLLFNSKFQVQICFLNNFLKMIKKIKEERFQWKMHGKCSRKSGDEVCWQISQRIRTRRKNEAVLLVMIINNFFKDLKKNAGKKITACRTPGVFLILFFCFKHRVWFF